MCIWLVGVTFVLFQFFLQLSSGVIVGSIMIEMHLSALMTGVLSSAFYYVYTSMQIPVGILFDRQSSRKLLTWNALLCSIGCFFFALNHHFLGLILARLIIGAGSSFAFVGLTHLLRQHFPLRQFAFMIGLSETLGFLITMLGMISLGVLVTHWGWRSFIHSAGLVGLIITYCCWYFIPDNKPLASTLSSNKTYPLRLIVTNPKNWINGLFVGLSFTVITVFAAMWAVPFLQVKLNCNLQQASLVDAMLFLGAAVSCPLFGQLEKIFMRRKPLMIGSCLFTAILLFVVLFFPTTNLLFLSILFFLIGACCGAYMLAYTIANELAPQAGLSTCTGFTNTLAMVSAPLLQPLIGYLLDHLNPSITQPNLHNYQWALTTVPLCLIIACFLVFFLPEKKSYPDYK